METTKVLFVCKKKASAEMFCFVFFLNVTPLIFSCEATMFPQLSAETLRKGRWRGCARQTLAVAQRQPAFLLQECHYDSGLIYLPIFTRTFFFCFNLPSANHMRLLFFPPKHVGKQRWGIISPPFCFSQFICLTGGILEHIHH